jgi:ribosomal protein L40E
MTTTPKCRKCGSTDIRATSSQQMRRINGKKRLVADAVCGNCGHTWWSYHPAIRKLAKQADAARKG